VSARGWTSRSDKSLEASGALAGQRARSYFPVLEEKMLLAMTAAPVLLAAVGYSLIYLLLCGGVGGAVVIYIIAKLLGR
jgi:hypothetical protein